MPHSIWAAALIAGTLAAVAASPAAAECLSAPNGPAAKGQHWHYHLDRGTHQKCWYLRDAAPPAAATGTAAEPQRNAAAAPPAKASPRAAAPAAPPEPAPAAAQDAAPEPPAAPQSTGSVWSDPPPAPAPAPTDAGAAPPRDVPAPTARPAPVQKAAPQGHPAAAARPETAPGPSPAGNLLVVALAAALAAVTFAIFMRMRSRKTAEAPLVPAPPSGPRFGSGGVRRDRRRRSAGVPDDAPALAPIEASLIPEQVPMPLPPLDTRR